MASDQNDANILPVSRQVLFGGTQSHQVQTKQLETFGRKVQATASHLLGGEGTVSHHYQNALGEIHRELRRPVIQRSLFSFAQTSPKEIYRSQLSKQEIQHRAIVTLPDELLHNIPESNSLFSLFQGFQASIPEDDKTRKKLKHRVARGSQAARKWSRGLQSLQT